MIKKNKKYVILMAVVLLVSGFVWFNAEFFQTSNSSDKETEEFMKEQIEWQENIDDATEEDDNAEIEEVKIKGRDKQDKKVEEDYKKEKAEPEKVMIIHENLKKINNIDDNWINKDVFRV